MPDQLRDIVSKMVEGGESEEDIAAVIQRLSVQAPVASHAPEPRNKLMGEIDAMNARNPYMKRLAESAETGGIVSAAPTAVGQAVQQFAPGVSNALKGGAERLYGGLLKTKQAVKDSFGGGREIAKTLLSERAPINARGLEKVTQRMGASRAKALDMVKRADGEGTQGVVPQDVLSEFKPVIAELRKRANIGQPSQLGAVGARGKAILRTTGRTGGDIPLSQAQALKETAQEASSGAYRAMERGAQKQLSADDLLDTAVARGLRKGVERQVPGVGPQNAVTQKLLGGTRALEDAVEREGNNNMLGGGRDWAALMAGGAGAAAGGPAGGLTAGALMRILATPSTGSKVAIGANELARVPHLDQAAKATLLSLIMGQQ